MRKGLVMVRRPVFVPESDKPYVSEISLDFEYFPGSFYSAEATLGCEFACGVCGSVSFVARSGGVVQE